MAYTITETLKTLDKTGYLMIDTNEINNIKMKTEKYIPKQGEMIWVWDNRREEKKLRVFKEFNKLDDSIYCYSLLIGNLLEGPLTDNRTFWSFYSKHEGIMHPQFKPQNKLLNFNYY